MEGYPRPRIPQNTVLSSSTFSGQRANGSHPSILEAGAVKFVTSGRMAIALALRHMGVARGDKVMVPAYHCSSMIEPVLWAGATPAFYRVHEDAAVDLPDIRAKIDANTKALLVTHYFGFWQNMPAIRALCDEAGIALIEDCAHTFFGTEAGHPPGRYGDYAIASAMKFFPVFDGGCLVSSRRMLDDVSITAGGFGFQLKAAINPVELALQYGRLVRLARVLRVPLRIKDALWNAFKVVRPRAAARDLGPAASGGGQDFDAAWLDKRMSVISRIIVARVSTSRIISRRRKHYRRMLEALSDLAGGRPLFPELPPGVVPYVFPMVVDDPDRVFPVLKRQAVPILRWEQLAEGVDNSVCPVSVRFSRCLLQFPCHEELSPGELEWMIGQIRSALSG